MDVLRSCCCCLMRPSELHLRTPYICVGKTEIYSDMIVNCFDINLALYNDECGICAVCVRRLRDASDFKLQVQRSQAELREWMERTQNVKGDVDEDGVKTEAYTTRRDDTRTTDACKVKCQVKGEILEDVATHGGEQIKHEFRPIMSDDTMSDDFKTANEVLECKLRTPETTQTHEPAPADSREHETGHMCQICHKTYKTRFKLGTHMRIHDKTDIELSKKFGTEFRKNEGDTYICNSCGKQFRRRYSIIRHIQGHYDVKLFPCHVCGKNFKHRSHLNTHGRIHTGYKPHSCHICQKQYGQKSALVIHMRVHTGEKPYECDQCKKRFSQISGLYTHQRTHTDLKGYSCDICKKEFRQKGNLKAHKRIHTGEKPFSCDVCHKEFAERSQLKRHTRVHTGERPYTCEICDKSFSEHSTYSRHKDTHLGKRPYTCDVCNRQFGRKCHLDRHKQTHTGEKRYCCELCGKRFLEKFTMTVHKRSHSRIEKAVEPGLCELELLMRKQQSC